ncbi:metal ABC transporter ATP-binding protein [Clostridium tetani]|uniref:Metal ABC transporter ATP-binding protein n=1 Tax=Clostridium tetani TaxID=1513 RepID=A0ABY0EQL2_CLOTA|nr:metal ABC transporter ATP-binding protein [Clostridium tetani]CDI50551.1 high-affinity Zinc uptake system ATP-bindingprotein znuC [Clostridium tetani 12124569]KHO32644.1 metal ABC transporter ATP-binding protein [Clostridium tetani]RXI39344.1 metal ABC transporter ATP-binding protein [Clostridium tetani]RXI57377.1 metal ABC transporter ATP-binding protein [Clostridium tetani]RXI66955.1 metal ABC transporter ATP-binding protein [Clostridium tetani]
MINIQDMYFSYSKDSSYILKNINLNIIKGGYYSIIGENGSGKSTLVKLILKLLNPSKGTISINTNKIGYVPQKLDYFNSKFPITVNEIFKCHFKALGLKNYTSLEELLKELDINHLKNNLIGNLSGGQQQRVFIARALIGNPDLLILDEPSTGVDILSQKNIYDFLKNLNINKQMTIISIEHNLKAAFENSSHIIKVENSTAKIYSTTNIGSLNDLNNI